MQLRVYFNIKLDANFHKFRPLFQNYCKFIILNKVISKNMQTLDQKLTLYEFSLKEKKISIFDVFTGVNF